MEDSTIKITKFALSFKKYGVNSKLNDLHCTRQQIKFKSVYYYIIHYKQPIITSARARV